MANETLGVFRVLIGCGSKGDQTGNHVTHDLLVACGLGGDHQDRAAALNSHFHGLENNLNKSCKPIEFHDARDLRLYLIGTLEYCHKALTLGHRLEVERSPRP